MFEDNQLAAANRLNIIPTAIRAAGAALVFLGLGCNAAPRTITWQDTSANEQGFRIYRIANQQKIVIAEVGPNVTEYTDAHAPRGACYIVTAFNAAGESPPTNSTCR